MYERCAAWFRACGCRSILDLGCGPAYLLNYLDSSVAYLGVDISPWLIAQNQTLYPSRSFQVGTWYDTVPFQPDGVFLGGVAYYHDNPLVFVQSVFERFNPEVVVLQDLATTDLRGVRTAYDVIADIEMDLPHLDTTPERKKRQLLAIQRVPEATQRYMNGTYAVRNDRLAEWVVGARHVVELAGGAVDLARRVLKMPVESYVWAEQDPVLLRYATRAFAADERVSVVAVDGNQWTPPECDTFISVSLEHLASDRDLIAGLRPGTNIYLSCPQFLSSNGSHLRCFQSAEEIRSRYGDLMTIHEIDDLKRWGGRKFLVRGQR